MRDMSDTKLGSGFTSQSCNFYRTLDANGHSMQEASCLSLGNGLFSGTGLLQGMFAGDLDERVQPGIEAFDLRQVRVDNFNRRDAPLLNEFRDLNRGERS